MFKFWLRGGRIQLPSFETPGGGSGGGSTTPGSGSPSGTGDRGTGADRGGVQDQNRGGGGAGDRGRSASGNAGSGDGNDAFAFSDDARLKLSDGRIVTGKQYRDELSASMKRDYDGRYKKGYDALLAEAERIDKLRSANGGNARQATADPLDALDLENQAVIDGRTAANLVKILRENGLGPIANVVKQLQGQVGQLQQQLKGTSSAVGTFHEERAAHDFEANLTKTIKSLNIKGLEERAVDPGDERLREPLRNLFLSYQPDSWKAGEFEKMAGEQLSSLVSWVRDLDRAHASGASDRLRKNFAPQRGAGQGRGNQPYKFESPRDIARRARESGMYGGVGNT